MFTNRKSRIKGFTLIELIVVLAVIGIISLIAVPKYLSIKEKAAEDACRESMNMIIEDIKLRYAMKNSVDAGSGDVVGTGNRINSEQLANMGINNKCPSGHGVYSISYITKSDDNDINVVIYCTEHGYSEALANFILDVKGLSSDRFNTLKQATSGQYIDSYSDLDSISAANKKILNDLFNLKGNVTYWNIGNKERVCWTNANLNYLKEVNELNENDLFYVPVYSYSCKDYNGIYAIYLARFKVTKDGNSKKLEFDRNANDEHAGGYEITPSTPYTNSPGYDDKKNFETVSKYYEKAMEIYNNKYNGKVDSSNKNRYYEDVKAAVVGIINK